MKKSKKKAFTLTELLVVVIVIGVLSAAVLPKFSKIIETRKTTEAEELMASVRTEQEKRCALDKPYLTAMSEMTDIVKNNGDTKNFTISLASSGIDAASKGKYSYTLKMPSYADGRICCDGTECSKLNKNYPTCDELRGKPDYQESPADCAGVPPVLECSGEAERACGCNNKGKQTRVCNTATGQWSAWGDCSIADTCECPASTMPDKRTSCNGCGHKTRTVTCDTETGEWKTGSWGTCDRTASQCNGGGGGGGDPEPPKNKCQECRDCASWFAGEMAKGYPANFVTGLCGACLDYVIDFDSTNSSESCKKRCSVCSPDCQQWLTECSAWGPECGACNEGCGACSSCCGSDCGSDCGSSCGSDCGGGASGGSSDTGGCYLCDCGLGSGKTVHCSGDVYMKYVNEDCTLATTGGCHCTGIAASCD